MTTDQRKEAAHAQRNGEWGLLEIGDPLDQSGKELLRIGHIAADDRAQRATHNDASLPQPRNRKTHKGHSGREGQHVGGADFGQNRLADAQVAVAHSPQETEGNGGVEVGAESKGDHQQSIHYMVRGNRKKHKW